MREALATGLPFTYLIHPARTGTKACALVEWHPIAAIILAAASGDDAGRPLLPRLRQYSLAPILLLTGDHRAALPLRGVEEVLR